MTASAGPLGLGRDLAHADYRATRHFGSLDGLRFFCITAVIWHHLPLWQRMTDLSVFFARGHAGVDFFFVISGFLITTLLLREAAERGRFSLRAFYWRRALRIVPIYVLTVGVATAYAVAKGDMVALERLPYYLAFLSNFLVSDTFFLEPTWSLAIEEQYYLLWPALLAVLPRAWIGPVLVALIAANVAVVVEAGTPEGLRSLEIGLLRIGMPAVTYAPILMGSLVAVVLHSPAGFARLAPWLAPQAAPWLLSAALLAAFAGFPGALMGWPNLVTHTLMTLIVASVVVREDNGMRPLLTLPPLVRIGQVSYGIYLYHLFALAAVTQLLPLGETAGTGRMLAVLALYYALAILLAEISFRSFERAFLRLRNRGWGRL